MPIKNLPLNRRLTRAFIAANPVTLVLVPRTRTKKPAGGWAWETGTHRDPQVMSLVEPGATPFPQVTADGIDREVNFILVAEWDAALEVGDVFNHEGRDWEVVEMFYDNGYERRAMVSGRG